MARHSIAECQRRHKVILAEVVRGVLPIKAICEVAESAESTVQTVMWRAGYRSMQVTADERALILSLRKKAAPNGSG